MSVHYQFTYYFLLTLAWSLLSTHLGLATTFYALLSTHLGLASRQRAARRANDLVHLIRHQQDLIRRP